MKYMEWNKELLLKQLNDLTELQKKNNRYDLISQTNALEALISDAITLFPIDENFEKQLKIDITTIDYYSDFVNDIKYFSELNDLFDSSKIITPRESIVNNTEVLSFIHDFYNHLDKEFATLFNKIFRERKNNLKFSNDRSYNIFIQELKYSYINIEKQNTIEDFINTGHEYAHSIADLMYPRTNYESKYPFLELLPIFIELLIFDELDKVYIGFETDLLLLKGAWVDTILRYAKDIILETKFLSQINEFKDKKNTIKDFAKFANINKKQVSNIFEKTIIERYAYVIPFLTALELYFIYKIDPEFALYTLKKIIKMEEVENYNEYLANNRIILNDNSKKYVTTISKELKKTKI